MHQKLSLVEILLCFLYVKTTAHMQTAAYNLKQIKCLTQVILRT